MSVFLFVSQVCMFPPYENILQVSEAPAAEAVVNLQRPRLVIRLKAKSTLKSVLRHQAHLFAYYVFQ